MYLTLKCTCDIHNGDKRKHTLDQFWNSKSPTLTPEKTMFSMSGCPSNLNHEVHKKYASKLNKSTSQMNKTLFAENMSTTAIMMQVHILYTHNQYVQL